MKKIILILLLPIFSLGQTLYNPQELYDGPGGLFDEDSLRTIELEFYMQDYHSYLVNAWFYNPSEEITGLTLNGVLHDSVGVRIKNSTFCLPNDVFSPKVPYNIVNYFIGGQKLLKYKKVKLANAWMDATF